MVNNFVVNPAFAGFNQRHTISLSTLIHKPLYKPSNDFNVPFEYSIAYDFNFGKRKNCGIGIDYKRFLGAAEGSLAVDLTFAYRINLAKYHNLRLGASASYIASDINKSDMTFPDMIDTRDGFVYNSNEVFPNKTTKNNFDLGMGVWYSWKTLYVGVSAIHLTSPEIGVVSKSKIPREYMLSAGYGVNLNKSLSVLPSTELKYIEKIINISPCMLFTYKRWLLFGIEFQNLRNAGLVLGYNLKNNVIINIYSGVPMNKDIIKNFGVIDYAGLSLHFQLGNYR
jgi:type IX secretion system PorP/SprF family membrane protein